jgi:hypothetical protein
MTRGAKSSWPFVVCKKMPQRLTMKTLGLGVRAKCHRTRFPNKSRYWTSYHEIPWARSPSLYSKPCYKSYCIIILALTTLVIIDIQSVIVFAIANVTNYSILIFMDDSFYAAADSCCLCAGCSSFLAARSGLIKRWTRTSDLKLKLVHDFLSSRGRWGERSSDLLQRYFCGDGRTRREHTTE